MLLFISLICVEKGIVYIFVSNINYNSYHYHYQMIKDCGNKILNYYILDSNMYIKKRLTEKTYIDWFYKVNRLKVGYVVENNVESGRRLIESFKMTRFKWYKI